MQFSVLVLVALNCVFLTLVLFVFIFGNLVSFKFKVFIFERDGTLNNIRIHIQLSFLIEKY